MARTLRLDRLTCESCGDRLDPHGHFVLQAAGKPLLKRMLCSECVVDTVQRQQAEARHQAEELQYLWGLDFARGDDGEPDDSGRRTPVP
jgi:hypothetical protein